MDANWLIDFLQRLPEEERKKPIMLEVERGIFLNLRMTTSDTRMKWITLSVFPDPFEEALKKAGVK